MSIFLIKNENLKFITFFLFQNKPPLNLEEIGTEIPFGGKPR